MQSTQKRDRDFKRTETRAVFVGIKMCQSSFFFETENGYFVPSRYELLERSTRSFEQKKARGLQLLPSSSPLPRP
jgi:hypothetical protein